MVDLRPPSNAYVNVGTELLLAGDDHDVDDGEEDKGCNEAANSAPEEDVFAIMVGHLLAGARNSGFEH